MRRLYFISQFYLFFCFYFVHLFLSLYFFDPDFPLSISDLILSSLNPTVTRRPLPRGPPPSTLSMSRGKPKEKEAVQGAEKVTAVVVATRRGLRT